jgi:hypothetical protein
VLDGYIVFAKDSRFWKTFRMTEKQPTPLQASFWLTHQEKTYILIICALFLLGLAARHFYLKNETTTVYTPAGIEEVEKSHE